MGCDRTSDDRIVIGIGKHYRLNGGGPHKRGQRRIRCHKFGCIDLGGAKPFGKFPPV